MHQARPIVTCAHTSADKITACDGQHLPCSIAHIELREASTLRAPHATTWASEEWGLLFDYCTVYYIDTAEPARTKDLTTDANLRALRGLHNKINKISEFSAKLRL